MFCNLKKSTEIRKTQCLKIKMNSVFFIDPQSYNNLSLYDKGVLSNMPINMVYFFGNTLWDGGMMDNVEMSLCFDYSNKSNPVCKVFNYLSSIFKILKGIRFYNPSLVHIQWVKVIPVDIGLIKYLKYKKIKIVYTAHNVLPHDSGDKYWKQFNRIYHLVDKIIAHSDITKKELIEQFSLDSDKIQVIPHGLIDIPVSDNDANVRANILKNQYGLNGKIVFSSLGIQSYYKGSDMIIEVWKKYFSSNPNVHLIFAGRNQNIDFSSIRNLKNVTVIDAKLSNLDFKAFVKLSDVILLPYRKISQSGVLFSAIENNIPVVVSNVGGLTDPLSIGNIGWSMGEPTVNNLCNVINSIITNPKILNDKTDLNEFYKVKKYYSWDRISTQTLDLYRSLIKL